MERTPGTTRRSKSAWLLLICLGLTLIVGGFVAAYLGSQVSGGAILPFYFTFVVVWVVLVIALGMLAGRWLRFKE